MKIIIFFVFLGVAQSLEDNVISKLLTQLLGSDNVLNALETNLLSIGKTNFIQKNAENKGKLPEYRLRKEKLLPDKFGEILIDVANLAPVRNLTNSLTTITSGVLDNNLIRAILKGLYKSTRGLNIAGGVGTRLFYELYETALRNKNEELANLFLVLIECWGTMSSIKSYTTISELSYNLFLNSYQKDDLAIDTEEYKDLIGYYRVPQTILVESNKDFSNDMSQQISRPSSYERCQNPELSSRSDDLINLLDSSMNTYAKASGPLGEQVMIATQAKEIMMAISCIQKTKI